MRGVVALTADSARTHSSLVACAGEGDVVLARLGAAQATLAPLDRSSAPDLSDRFARGEGDQSLVAAPGQGCDRVVARVEVELRAHLGALDDDDAQSPVACGEGETLSVRCDSKGGEGLVPDDAMIVQPRRPSRSQSTGPWTCRPNAW